MHTVSQKDLLPKKERSFTHIGSPENAENKNIYIYKTVLFFQDSNKSFLRAKVCKKPFNYLKQRPSDFKTRQSSSILHLYQLYTYFFI